MALDKNLGGAGGWWNSRSDLDSANWIDSVSRHLVIEGTSANHNMTAMRKRINAKSFVYPH